MYQKSNLRTLELADYLVFLYRLLRINLYNQGVLVAIAVLF